MKEHKKKERLDVLLVKRGLAESREKAKAIIMTGNVFVKEQRAVSYTHLGVGQAKVMVTLAESEEKVL